MWAKDAAALPRTLFNFNENDHKDQGTINDGEKFKTGWGGGVGAQQVRKWSQIEIRGLVLRVP